MKKANLPGKEKVVRDYELTYLVSVSLTESEVSKIKEEIEALLKKHQAEQVAMVEWGKKALAYQIKHGGNYLTQARYFHATFRAASQEVQALDKNLYLQPALIRHLLVVADLRQPAGVASLPQE